MTSLVKAGEMLVVLGPPGSGCSTFLKTIAGETHGFSISDDSYINYQGISPKQMHSHFRGEAIYTAEVEVCTAGRRLLVVTDKVAICLHRHRLTSRISLSAKLWRLLQRLVLLESHSVG